MNKSDFFNSVYGSYHFRSKTPLITVNDQIKEYIDNIDFSDGINDKFGQLHHHLDHVEEHVCHDIHHSADRIMHHDDIVRDEINHHIDMVFKDLNKMV